MIREERLNLLSEYIKSKHYVSIEELIQLLKVSKATVRRDLLYLEEQGTISVTRGGAFFQDADIQSEPSYFEKNESNIAEKKEIGKEAAKQILPGKTIFIGAGTTARCMVPFLAALPSFNLVTNDLLIAADSTNYTNINITVTGGQLRKNYYTVRGFAAENYLNNIHMDIAFLSMDAVDIRTGCFIANADEVSLLQKVIGSAEKVILLCDHTKFNNKAFMLVCPLDKIDMIITDHKIDEKTLKELQMRNIPVVLS